MGTRMAPSYANIFIASLGQQMLLHSPHNLLPFIWLRFIDDIFMLWTHGSTVLTIFLQHINSFNHTIKLSHQQSHTPITFLDITIPLTNKGHYSPHSTSNPPTKNYYSTTPPTTRQPVKRAQFTAKPFDTNVLSPTNMTYANIYNDYTKSSWSEAIPIPPSLLHSFNKVTSHTQKTNYSDTSQHQPQLVSTFNSLYPIKPTFHQSHTFYDNIGTLHKTTPPVHNSSLANHSSVSYTGHKT